MQKWIVANTWRMRNGILPLALLLLLTFSTPLVFADTGNNEPVPQTSGAVGIPLHRAQTQCPEAEKSDPANGVALYQLPRCDREPAAEQPPA